MRGPAEIAVIAAVARNGAIGRGNALLFDEPADQRHFRATTLGCPVIMGRKTWDSLPPRFRPLPGRQNLVVTRRPDWSETGAQRTSSVREALSICEHSTASEVWVIGGAQIYAEALPLAQRALITEIDQDFEGDAHAPAFPADAWRETARNSHVSSNGLNYSFVTLERR